MRLVIYALNEITEISLDHTLFCDLFFNRALQSFTFIGPRRKLLTKFPGVRRDGEPILDT